MCGCLRGLGAEHRKHLINDESKLDLESLVIIIENADLYGVLW